jgi:hypothetical protein
MCQEGNCKGSDFLIDSGANVHIVNSQSLLFKPVVYQPLRSLSLVTSDANGALVASGDVCLMSPLGVPLWLHNVQCVIAATTNLISVSAAISYGVEMVTIETGAISQLLGPNRWECPVKDVDGLYVLHGVSPSLPPPQGAGQKKTAEAKGETKVEHAGENFQACKNSENTTKWQLIARRY